MVVELCNFWSLNVWAIFWAVWQLCIQTINNRIVRYMYHLCFTGKEILCLLIPKLKHSHVTFYLGFWRYIGMHCFIEKTVWKHKLVINGHVWYKQAAPEVWGLRSITWRQFHHKVIINVRVGFLQAYRQILCQANLEKWFSSIFKKHFYSSVFVTQVAKGTAILCLTRIIQESILQFPTPRKAQEILFSPEISL